jgi:hypothetical protein
LGAGAGFEVLEKGGLSAAEVVTENAEGAWGVPEAFGHLLGGEPSRK